MNTTVFLSLFLCVVLAIAQKPQKGSPENLQLQPAMYETDTNEAINRVSVQLMNALAALENIQEGSQMKVAEKRRNKFEFIRFGRK